MICGKFGDRAGLEVVEEELQGQMRQVGASISGEQRRLCFWPWREACDTVEGSEPCVHRADLQFQRPDAHGSRPC